MKLTGTLLWAVFLGLAFAHPAFATTAELELISGATTVTVLDNGSGDFNNTVGVVDYNGTVGGWAVSLAGGVSQAPGLGTSPLSLTSTISAAGPTAPLEILFSDTGFNTGASSYSSVVGGAVTGTGAGSLTQSAYLSNADTIFAMTIPIGTNPTITGAGGNSVSGGSPGIPPYSLTLEQYFTDTSGAESFAFNGSIEPAPELPSLLLFGTGLLAIGGLLRRKTLPS